jgi:hypothetical protein
MQAVAACSDGAPGGPQLPECGNKVTLAVTDGTSPEFSWTPECRLLFVLVEAMSGEDQWAVITPGANGIAPPVRYGVVPDGAVEASGPAALDVGTSYRLVVARWIGPDPTDEVLIAARFFTP